MNILYVLEVLLGFGFVIFIHEMGHFLAAKKVGITCHAFSIGFPMPFVPKKFSNIFAYTWKGTEYRLGWVPFGGYVQMKGQADNPNLQDGHDKEDTGDYRNKTYWQKTMVLLGGVTMNAVTAVIGFVLAFQFGVTFIEPTVGLVDPGGKAWEDNQIQVGDKITKVNGRDVVDFEDVVYAGLFDGGESIDVTLERKVDGETVTKDVTVPLDEDSRFGIALPAIKAQHRVLITEEEAAKFPDDLETRPEDGDEIVAIRGKNAKGKAIGGEVLNAPYIQGVLAMSRGPVSITFRRGVGEDAEEFTVDYTPERHFFGDASAYQAGMSLRGQQYVHRVRKNAAGDKAGLKSGDKLVGVVKDDKRVTFNSHGELVEFLNDSDGNTVRLVIERDGKPMELDVTPDERDYMPGSYALSVTVSPVNPKGLSDKEIEEKLAEIASTIKVYGVRKDGVADKAGIVAGDVLVGIQVDSQEVTNPETGEFDMIALATAMIQATGMDAPELTFQVQRSDGVKDIVVKPLKDGPDSVAVMKLSAAEKRSDPVTYGFVDSITQGFYHSKKVGYKILMTFGGLFTGRIKIYHLGGPAIIAKRSYDLAQWGIGTLIFFLAFISVNLAVVNLIPLPVLDGGQWLIVTIEAIRGKPLPEKAMIAVQWVSFVAVIGLMLFVVGNDLYTIFWRKWV